ncbi:MAG: hypothetical protein LBT40_04635 [Deltaproteobacteria bacterium]|nr:hypothetical protein [Deltaproteobacteria bacterium]
MLAVSDKGHKMLAVSDKGLKKMRQEGLKMLGQEEEMEKLWRGGLGAEMQAGSRNMPGSRQEAVKERDGGSGVRVPMSDMPNMWEILDILQDRITQMSADYKIEIHIYYSRKRLVSHGIYEIIVTNHKDSRPSEIF